MNDCAFYCKCLDDKFNEAAYKKALAESNKNPLLEKRFAGISFFITIP